VRNLGLVDAVVMLHEIARVVAAKIGIEKLHDDIRNCADRLHQLSIIDGKNVIITQDIINKAKK